MLKTLFLSIIPLSTFAYENIALHKSAWQLYPYGNRFTEDFVNASNAVDGLKTDLSFFGNQCTQSAIYKYEAMWRVDLGAILGIDSITIYYRTDNRPWGPSHGFVSRFLGFSVYISNTTEKEDGVLCFRDDNFTNETIPAVITLNCTHHGNYVIYYNNRTSSKIPPYYSQYAYNELCEFEVYECKNNTYGAGCLEKCGQCLGGEKCNFVNGICSNGCEAGYYNFSCKAECPDGQYGRNCLQTCSENCHVSKTCDKKTGACHGGCIEGWKLPQCNKECDDGTFGTNCSNVCGHCYQGKPCDKKTGVCPPVCDSGYEGLYCNQSKEINRDDSNSDQGPSSTPLTDETEFSPLTGKLNLRGVHTGFETHEQQFVKDKLVQPPRTQQAVVNQPMIVPTEQSGQSSASPNLMTFPEKHSFEGKHSVIDSQSDVFRAEIEKLKLEMEYIKVLTKKVSSEIEILELKKKSLSANCTVLSSSEQQ